MALVLLVAPGLSFSSPWYRPPTLVQLHPIAGTMRTVIHPAHVVDFDRARSWDRVMPREVLLRPIGETRQVDRYIRDLEEFRPKAEAKLEAYRYQAEIGLLHQQRGDYAKARERYEDARAALPARGRDIAVAQGLTYLYEGNLVEAERRLAESTPRAETRKVRAAGYLALGLISFGKGQSARGETKAYLSKAIAAGAPTGLPRLLLALVAGEEGRCPALERYMRGNFAGLNKSDQGIKPYLAVAHYARGACYHERALKRGMAMNDLYRMAKEDYDRSLAYWELATVYPNRGFILYHQLNLPQESRVDFERAITLDARNDTAFYNLACWHALVGSEEAAIRNLRRAIDINPSNRTDARRDDDFRRLRHLAEFRKLVE